MKISSLRESREVDYSKYEKSLKNHSFFMEVPYKPVDIVVCRVYDITAKNKKEFTFDEHRFGKDFKLVFPKGENIHIGPDAFVEYASGYRIFKVEPDEMAIIKLAEILPDNLQELVKEINSEISDN